MNPMTMMMGGNIFAAQAGHVGVRTHTHMTRRQMENQMFVMQQQMLAMQQQQMQMQMGAAQQGVPPVAPTVAGAPASSLAVHQPALPVAVEMMKR